VSGWDCRVIGWVVFAFRGCGILPLLFIRPLGDGFIQELFYSYLMIFFMSFSGF
jgi:hypothetical protein